MATPISSLDSDAPTRIPMPADLAGGSTPLANQVAGHQNVRADASGSLVIKPSLAKEIALYQMVNAADRTSKLAKLKRFIPQFYGTLRLEGQMDDTGSLQTLGSEVPESVVLQNLAYAFTHPNIMDAKLGTVLYEPSANAEKKAKMERDAQNTTTATTGLRLTGCQAWHAPSETFILTPKTFGKKITTDQLPSGMIRFFPSPSDTIPSLVVPTTAPESTSTPETVLTEYKNHTIPPKTMIRVLELIDKELADLETVLQTLEMRFVGSSVLVVYEGDLPRLEHALDQWEEKLKQRDPLASEPEPNSDDELEEDEDEDEDDDDLDLDGEKEDAKAAKDCPPIIVKMIDFAHTWITEGDGVDHGVLKGLATLRSLVQGRRRELEAAAA